MTGKWFVRAVVTALLATSAVAQMRMPCTGVVRDADGKPLANALVVADWQPDEAVFGPPDRHETRTDADGKFAFELWIGHEYCTWVIGPADADKTRLVVPPRWCAVGGKQLELVARVRTSPVRLDVRGTTPWLPDGPLALRVFVASGAALPDFPIPGDGLIALPPLPTTRFTVALVDGRGQVLDHVITDADDKAPCTFAPITERLFEVTGDNDAPQGEATIVAMGSIAHTTTPPVCRWSHRTFARTIATTGKDGRAVGRFVVRGTKLEHLTFFAAGRDQNAISKPSGWSRGTRFHHGRAEHANDDDPLPFKLAETIARTTKVVNGDTFTWSATGSMFLSWTAGNHASIAFAPWPCEAKAGPAWTSRVGESDISLRLFASGRGPIPHQVVIPTDREQVDVSQLRTITLQVSGKAGAKVPFASVAAGHTNTTPGPWLMNLGTDSEGRAKLSLPDVGFRNLVVCAFTESAIGVQGVDNGTDTLEIQVDPYVDVQIRVLDATDGPVAGAFLSSKLAGGITAGGVDELAQTGLACAASGTVTGPDGLVRIPVARPHLRRHRVVAHWRGVESVPVTLDERGEMVLRLPK